MPSVSRDFLISDNVYYYALCAWVKIAESSSRRMQACQDLSEEEQARN